MERENARFCEVKHTHRKQNNNQVEKLWRFLENPNNTNGCLSSSLLVIVILFGKNNNSRAGNNLQPCK